MKTKSMTGIFHGVEFFRTYWIVEPTSDDIYHDSGLVMAEQPTKRDFSYWNERDIKAVHVVDREAYSKCLLDLNEMTAKYNFMVDSAQQNAKERDAVEFKLIEIKTLTQIDDGLKVLKLFDLDAMQIHSLIKFYEAQTGNKAEDIE